MCMVVHAKVNYTGLLEQCEVLCVWFYVCGVHLSVDGAIVETMCEEDVMNGDDGGGWEVEDDELQLPPDMVREITPSVAYVM